jgi:thymidine phosphorylase
MNADAHTWLKVVRAGIDTYQQAVVYMHRDCPVCRSEGFAALTRIQLRIGSREILATLNVVTENWLAVDTLSLSEAAWTALAPQPGELASVSHAEPPASAPALRAKVFGERLSAADFVGLMRDTVDNRLSDIELAAFVTACAGERLDHQETIDLTRAMIAVGQRIDWGIPQVLDKHCVGGLPGNRTTPIVVAIIAAAGYLIPKTSSRAITSPAGTADTMAVMAPVALDLAQMRRVVEAEGGCIVWGGSVRLSPADDVLIRIERPLDFDSDGQLVASVLSKKCAAGSTTVLIDIPIGPTAKVRSLAAADSLEARLRSTAEAIGLTLSVLRSDGLQPVGYGIGPALEARDVLQVLRNDPAAPMDLRNRALDLAGRLLDIAASGTPGRGRDRASALLDDGSAWLKFLAICNAQGGFTEPVMAAHSRPILATRAGTLGSIDNRRLAKVAKLAGAPGSAGAGLDFALRLGDQVQSGDPLFVIHAQSRGELGYAVDYAVANPDICRLQEL